MVKLVPASAEELARRGIVPEQDKPAPQTAEQKEIAKPAPKRKRKAKE